MYPVDTGSKSFVHKTFRRRPGHLLNVLHCEKYLDFTNFLMWKFCGKAQFPHSFRQFARNYAETVPFYKISTHGIFCSVMYVLFTPCVYGVCKSLVIPATMRWRASPLLTVKNMLFDVTSDLTFKLLYKMID